MIKVLFFAALREQLNSEEISLPLDKMVTVEHVIESLVTKNPDWKTAFSHTLLCAINQEMVTKNHTVKSGDEVAFFPPVTGG
ncbi:MAG: molybdopterin converting factor subunit 1 [Thalassotalea sp.]|nr:molybdopterin converting factor subunit 1 [Thalassotalea sp.]